VPAVTSICFPFFFKKERKKGRKKEEMFMASISECDEQR
jgi:hypothetical protein